MNDTEWAVEMSDPDTAPDYLLDALKNARDLGPEDYADEVIGTAAGMFIESEGTTAVVNALVLGLQAFGNNMKLQMVNGPVIITFEARDDAPTQ